MSVFLPENAGSLLAVFGFCYFPSAFSAIVKYSEFIPQLMFVGRQNWLSLSFISRMPSADDIIEAVNEVLDTVSLGLSNGPLPVVGSLVLTLLEILATADFFFVRFDQLWTLQRSVGILSQTGQFQVLYTLGNFFE